MPLALSPKSTVEVCLETDKAKAADVRPVFLFRFLTCRQAIEVDELLAKAHAGDGHRAKNDTLNQALAVGMAGWRNMGREFDAAKLGELLDDLLTPAEKWELVYSSISETMAKESDLKKSASQSDSNTATFTATPAANA